MQYGISILYFLGRIFLNKRMVVLIINRQLPLPIYTTQTIQLLLDGQCRKRLDRRSKRGIPDNFIKETTVWCIPLFVKDSLQTIFLQKIQIVQKSLFMVFLNSRKICFLIQIKYTSIFFLILH